MVTQQLYLFICNYFKGKIGILCGITTCHIPCVSYEQKTLVNEDLLGNGT